MNSGMNGITIFIAAIIVMACASVISLLNALVEHPWLWLFVIAAIVVFFMWRRAVRHERGGR